MRRFGFAGSFVGRRPGLDGLVERLGVSFGREESFCFGYQRSEHVMHLGPRHRRTEKALSDIALPEKQRVSSSPERLVIEPEHGEKLLLRDPPQHRREHGFIERLPLGVEQRVVLPLAPDELERCSGLGEERPSHAQVGHLVGVRVGRVLGDAVEQAGDGAQGGALTGLVLTEDDVNPGRRKI